MLLVISMSKAERATGKLGVGLTQWVGMTRSTVYTETLKPHPIATPLGCNKLVNSVNVYIVQKGQLQTWRAGIRDPAG